jgi:hypothetical protein
MARKKRPKTGARPTARRQVRSRNTVRVAGMSGHLSLRNWDTLKGRLIDGIRASERLTKEDLAIRINARD